VTSTSTSTSGAKGIFVLIGIALLALVLAGFVTGAIGAAFFGTDSLLPEPGVHLPAQMILGDDAGKTLDGGTSFVLTNTILSSLITSGILIALFVIGTARLKVVPGRIQGLLESIIEGLLGFIESLMGVGKGRAILPLIATIFLFVSFNSWIALLPVYQSFGITRYETITLDELNHFAAGQEVTKDDLVHLVEERNAAAHPGEEAHHVIERIEIVNEGTLTKPLIVEAHRFNNGVEAAIVAAGGEIDPTSPGINATFVRPAGTDLNMPLALALIVFVFVEVLGIRAHGIGYFGEFFRFGNLFRGKILTGLIDVFVGLLEGISHLVRVVSFTFRLFGNMTAGEILLLVSSFLVSFVFSIPFYGLELVVGLIQAVIFAGLTVVFAAMAVASHEEEEH
jgi:F-type H+-transporting ATPase subunit a